jgi:flagellin
VSDGTTGGTLTTNAAIAVASVSLAGTASIAAVDTALDAINTVLGNIGAGQNRLDYTLESIKSAVVNVKAAESTLRDVDMAEEMANYTKQSILTQAAQAMLSQANQSSQSVLSLLR